VDRGALFERARKNALSQLCPAFRYLACLCRSVTASSTTDAIAGADPGGKGTASRYTWEDSHGISKISVTQ
jgi:hypothetical protein